MNFGIDFGTTNSAVAVYDDRTRTFDRVGDVTDNNTPISSAISIDLLNDAVAAGRGVRNNILHLLDAGTHLVVTSVKSALDTDQVFDTQNKSWNSEEIATELFRALKRRTFDVTGLELDNAVVAIPVGMNSAKRKVLRRAANRAGIDVSAFVSEPTAAFFSHSEELENKRYVLVFDWGGGTLDVCLLEHRNGRITERHTLGLPKAGDHIDEIVARWIHERIAERHNVELSFEGVSPDDRQRLLSETERVKLHLQEDGVTNENIVLGQYAGIDYIDQSITSEVFNALIDSVVDEAIDLLFKCIENARVSVEEVGKVLIVGGTSQLKLFRNKLNLRWVEVGKLMFPAGADWAIANGAARLANRPGNYRTSEAIGLELSDGRFHTMIRPETTQIESKTKASLGLVEDTSSATIIFSTRASENSSHTNIGEMFVPCKGFLHEIITVDCEITADLVLLAQGESNHIEGKKMLFEYEHLRWRYDFGD